MTEHSEQHPPEHSQPEHSQPQPASTDLGDHATGDLVVDAALQDLQNAPADDLDAQLEAAGRVHQTLQARLSDLGGA